MPAAAKNSPRNRALPAARAALPIETLKRRPDFLAAARAQKVVTPGFILQARARTAPETGDVIRIGYTCSKKVGGAVERNRAKRRLRAVARAVLPLEGCAGWDYVLIGLRGRTIPRAFDLMLRDLAAALAQIHGRRA